VYVYEGGGVHAGSQEGKGETLSDDLRLGLMSCYYFPMAIQIGSPSPRVVAYSIVGIAAIVTAVIVGLDNDLNNSEWATWVQAVGSIAALAAAFAVGNRQHDGDRKLEAERRRDDDLRKYEVIRAIFAQTHSVAKSVLEDVYHHPLGLPTKLQLELLDDCAHSLSLLPPFELPHEELVLYWANIPRAVRKLRDILTVQKAMVEQSGIVNSTQREQVGKDIDEVLLLSSAAGRFCHTRVVELRVLP
jgi:hypothetical protein